MNTPNFETKKLFSDVNVYANVVLKADADCSVLCDGKEVCVLKGNIPQQINVVEGTHLFTFISSKNKKVAIDRKLACTINDNTILCVQGLAYALINHKSFFQKLLDVLKITKADNNVDILFDVYMNKPLGILNEGIEEHQVQLDLPIIRKKANEGIARYQYLLGRLYYEEMGVVKNLEVAEKWFELADKQGYAHAACSLGTIKWQNDSVGSAKSWFKKSAVKGLARAQRNLGILYLERYPRDYKMQAETWLKKAANQGDFFATQYLNLYSGNRKLVEEARIELKKIEVMDKRGIFVINKQIL